MKEKKKGRKRGSRSPQESRAPSSLLGAVPWDGRHTVILFAVLTLVPILAYCNALPNEFVFDDIYLIVQNPFIKDSGKILDALGPGSKATLYRPVRSLSYALDYQLFQMNPWGYRLSNLLYHLITCLLVYRVALALTAHRGRALLAALLFSLHPVHTDSITYISGRRDILSTLFFLGGFASFIRYRKVGSRRWLTLSLGAYILAIGSKEMAVTLPAVFLLYDTILLVEEREVGSVLGGLKALGKSALTCVRRYSFLYVPFFLLALVFTYYKAFMASPSHQEGFYGGSALNHAATVLRILVYYMKLLIVPVTLHGDYSYNAFPVSVTPWEMRVFLSLCFLVGVFFALFKVLLTRKWVAFAGLWFFVTLLPVCHIFPHHELLAEHYLYLPSFGFCLFVSLTAYEAYERSYHKKLLVWALAFVITLFFVRIVDRNRDWRDSLTFWEKTVRTTPQCARALNNLAVEYNRAGRHNEAIEAHRKAVTLKPAYPDAHYNLGNAHKDAGHYEDAVEAYLKTLELNPRHARAYNNLGIVYRTIGKPNRAAWAFNAAAQRSRSFVEAQSNLLAALNDLGRYDAAITLSEEFVRKNPGSAELHNNRGVAYFRTDDYETALHEYREALEIQPDLASAHLNIGILYADKLGMRDEAVFHLKRTLELVPGQSQAGAIQKKIAFLQDQDTRNSHQSIGQPLK